MEEGIIDMKPVDAIRLLDEVTAVIPLPRAQHERIRDALQTLAVATSQPPVQRPPQPKNPAEPPETK